MEVIKLGIHLESLGLPLRAGLQQAEHLGVAGVQFNAVGDLGPRGLTQTGRREIGHWLRSHGLQLAAIRCPLRHGLSTPEGLEARIDHVKSVLVLGYELGTRRVLVEADKIPSDLNSMSGRCLTEALDALGRHGDRVGAVLALAPGQDTGADWNGFLARFDTGSLGISVDPCNWLVHGFDPMAQTRALAGRVVDVQAHDARKSGANRMTQEVPLGHGDIDWLQFIGVLEEIDYHGWMTVRCDVGENRILDISEGVRFLRRLGIGARPGD